MGRIITNMSAQQKLRILYGIVERDVKEIYNLRLELPKDPEKRLALFWEDLENTYGNGEWDPCKELDAINRHPSSL